MPATSQAQQEMSAIAANSPSKRNKGVTAMSSKDLHDFASTKRKGLPKKRMTMGDMMGAA